MEQNKFTINKEDLPSKMYDIVLQEPTFEDRKTAIKRMPTNPNSNPGYDVTHLLLSMSIFIDSILFNNVNVSIIDLYRAM